MSAEIGSVEPITAADTSVELEAATASVGAIKIESHENLPPDEGDPADFLLSSSEYHDCFLTVGNPDCEKVESIGVTSVELIAHSPVFRKMLKNYKQADLPQAEINITDVSPATFKLMLRFVYGGKLPKMSAIETAGLALCADKYNISRLVQKSLKRLVPSGIEDVFPALICVTYASFPDLEVQVTKIVQQETDKVVQNDQFLKLDENCVIFMLKQEILNIDEVELWKHVVRWAEHQVKINPVRTVRGCLAKILEHVRFLSFTIEEILKHVLPKKILNPEEYMELSLALTTKQSLESPLLCKIQRRGLYVERVIATPTTDNDEGISLVAVNDTEKAEISVLKDKLVSTICKGLYILNISDHCNLLEHVGHSYSSTFSIKPSNFIQIVSFTCNSRDRRLRTRCVSSSRKIEQTNTSSYKFICYITVIKPIKDVAKRQQVIKVTGEEYDGIVYLPLLEKSQDPLILCPNETWTFTLEFNVPYPTYKLSNPILLDGLVNIEAVQINNFTIMSNASSVLKISYRG